MTSDTFSDLNRHATKKLVQFGDLKGWDPRMAQAYSGLV